MLIRVITERQNKLMVHAQALLVMWDVLATLFEGLKFSNYNSVISKHFAAKWVLQMVIFSFGQTCFNFCTQFRFICGRWKRNLRLDKEKQLSASSFLGFVLPYSWRYILLCVFKLLFCLCENEVFRVFWTAMIAFLSSLCTVSRPLF